MAKSESELERHREARRAEALRLVREGRDVVVKAGVAYRSAIVHALDEDVGVNEVAEAAILSRQRVWQIAKEERRLRS